MGRFVSGASDNIVNAVPTAANNNTGWGPTPSLTELSSALPAEPKFAIAVRTSAGAYAIYAATASAAYKLDSSDWTWDEVGTGYSLPSGELWSGVQFGHYLVITNSTDGPQYIDVDVGAAFGALSGSPPAAKYVWVAGEHLVLGNHASYPQRIQTSGRGDISYWTVGQKGCDLQDLPDGEDVMGGVGAESGSVIFQRKAIRRMVLGAPGDYAFRLEVVNANRGAVAPHSIVSVGPSGVAYLSSDGFAMDAGNMIGEGQVDRYFYADVFDASMTRGVVDPYAHIIWWLAEFSFGNRLIGYHYNLKRWCISDEAIIHLIDLATPAITIDGLANLYASIDAISETFDSRLFSGGLRAFAGFTSDYKLGFFTGSNAAAQFDTWEMQLTPGRRSFLSEARVVTDATTHTLKAATSSRNSGTAPTFGSAVSPNSSTGICHFRADGLLHKFRLDIAAGEDWSHVYGLEDIRAVPTGRR